MSINHMKKLRRNKSRFVLLASILALSACQTMIMDAAPPMPSVVVATPFLTEETPLIPTNSLSEVEEDSGAENFASPLAIEALRARDYPASELTIEQTLEPGANYQRHIAYYSSDGFRIYGLLTVPNADMPEGGYAAILFLHGYIPPDTYVTTADYVATQDGLARSGFVTFKPDLRGHGRSEGEATGAHFSETYVVDSLNAFSTLEAYDLVNSGRIGIWGHSNGGLIGLRMIAVTDRAKAAVFWAGVVGSYVDMLETHIARIDFLQRLSPPVIEEFGLPSDNTDYWNAIDPFHFLDDITTPVQLHHGNSDTSVPVELSISLNNSLLAAGREVELFQYPGMDHNFFGEAFNEAMNRTVEFFRLNL